MRVAAKRHRAPLAACQGQCEVVARGMPTYPTDAQIDAHVLAEEVWEDMLAEADAEQDELEEAQLPPAPVDYMEAYKRLAE